MEKDKIKSHHRWWVEYCIFSTSIFVDFNFFNSVANNEVNENIL